MKYQVEWLRMCLVHNGVPTVQALSSMESLKLLQESSLDAMQQAQAGTTPLKLDRKIIQFYGQCVEYSLGPRLTW